MKLIDELDGKLLKLWKFWSVRWGVISGACSGAVAAYEGFKAMDAALVRWVPEQAVGVLVLAAVLCTFASILSRGIPQPKLREPSESDDNAEHA
ncbi:hypothetical protein EAH75_04375 [Rhodanobacter glycinis]|uniref:DUF7940 domain-containing protein n=1 Tax=Rhodanobacter glycinis TaxID=582702 RepID=UPI00112D0ECE|nr:hypothetical protein [Rhodanobacter glycinis]TPG50681.1 hypothetical protein EAH75_04375 [Rhodanobacter glycinis]